MSMFAGDRPSPTRCAEGPTSRVRSAHCAIVIRVGRDFREATKIPGPGIATGLPLQGVRSFAAVEPPSSALPYLG